MYPTVENIIVVPIKKRIKIIMSIQVCFILWMNFDYKENEWKEKLLLQIQSIDIVHPNEENMMYYHNKRNGDYYE